jgi:hypothetical protein
MAVTRVPETPRFTRGDIVWRRVPLGHRRLSGEVEYEGFFLASSSGEYQLVFDNKSSLRTPKDVTLYYQIRRTHQ